VGRNKKRGNDSPFDLIGLPEKSYLSPPPKKKENVKVFFMSVILEKNFIIKSK